MHVNGDYRADWLNKRRNLPQTNWRTLSSASPPKIRLKVGRRSFVLSFAQHAAAAGIPVLTVTTSHVLRMT